MYRPLAETRTWAAMETLSQLKGFLRATAPKWKWLCTQSKVKRGSLIVFGGDNVVGTPGEEVWLLR